jgi:predicted TIM-barrel fold metal-dependent hydrolase
MKNGMIVFDAVVHNHDFRENVMLNDDARYLKEGFKASLTWSAQRGGHDVSYDAVDAPPEHAWANKVLFEDSDTDFAMVQTVPVFALFKEGLAPAKGSYELAQSNPDRLFFCGGVDPLYQGVKGALEEMQRQVEEWGATSFKFYQAQNMRNAWSADDEKLAYPLYEKAIELGIKGIQFHKGLPLGLQKVEDLRPNDLQQAAYDFPQLNFGAHHLGEPYVDEMINIASRFPNIFLVLPLWFNHYFVQPWEMLHRLGKALLHVGADRICYGTDAFIWPNLQAYIDVLATLEMPEELQDRYGYPPITDDVRRKIFGESFANAVGIDLAAKAKELEISKQGA